MLTDGVRRAVLLTDRLVAGGDEDEPAGVLLLGPDNAIVMSDAAADAWLGELRESGPGDAVPQTVSAVAARARGARGRHEHGAGGGPRTRPDRAGRLARRFAGRPSGPSRTP